MTHEQQDKLWNDLSEEDKGYYSRQYIESQTSLDPRATKLLEDLFGSHNLNLKPLTYEDVAKELFEGKTGYVFDQHDRIKEFDFGNCGLGLPLNCTTEKQAEKICAINRLINVAKYLNKNEDGSDWKPDWENETYDKWCIEIWKEKINVSFLRTSNHCPVYFRTIGLAQQAIQILGKETIRLALSNDY